MGSGKAKILLIAGVHRSGTSLACRLLEELGVDFGENLLPGIEGINDDGFWEDIEFVDINEHLLNNLDSSWFSIQKFPELWFDSPKIESVFSRAIDWFTVFSKDKPLIALKDPRVCRLMPFWGKVFEHFNLDVKYLYVSRSPSEVARSLRKRDGFSLSIGYLIWVVYVSDFFKYINGQRVSMITYEDLIRNKISVLEDAVGIDLGISLKKVSNDERERINGIIKVKNNNNLVLESFEFGNIEECARELHDYLRVNRQLDFQFIEKCCKGFDVLFEKHSDWIDVIERCAVDLVDRNKNLTYLSSDLRSKEIESERVKEENERVKEENERVKEEIERVKEASGRDKERVESYIEKIHNRISQLDYDVASLDSTKKLLESNLYRLRQNIFVRFYEKYFCKSCVLKDHIVDVVVPVYDGYEETKRCLESIIRFHDTSIFEIVVINDASPNDKLVRYLEFLSGNGQITLIQNKENLGFVSTVNKGMMVHPDRDVILLNSDTVVYSDWVSRMRYHALQSSVGTVTPLSNNATICSFPNICQENKMVASVDLLDEICKKIGFQENIEMPTGVGFCMYISRDCLREVGLFNVELFKKGYGEENDFCMRAKKIGWKNVLAKDVFVEHVGRVSFSSESEIRSQEAQKKLDMLYPEYHRLVHGHILKNELSAYRLKIHSEAIRRLNKKVVLLVTHNLGGGVEKHIKDLNAYKGDEGVFVQISPGDQANEIVLRLDPDSTDELNFYLPKDHNVLLDFLKSLNVSLIYVHHLIGVCIDILDLANKLNCAIDYMLHDYYVINGSPTLTDTSGRYVSVFDDDFDQKCLERYALPQGITASEWRLKQLDVLSRCRAVRAPSFSCQKIVNHFYPDISIDVVYHLDSVKYDYRLPCRFKNRKNRVLILGALSKEKGAELLESVALETYKKNQNVEFHLLGYAYRKLKKIIDHGKYDANDIQDLIEKINPDVIWFPALWPETYSYTLSQALESGRFIIAPDIGAFSERLHGRGESLVVDWSMSSSMYSKTIISVLNGEFSRNANSKNEWLGIYKNSKSFYASFWDNLPEGKMGSQSINSSLDFSKHVSNKSDWSFKRRVLVLLVGFKRSKYSRKFSNMIPLYVQENIKKYLMK